MAEPQEYIYGINPIQEMLSAHPDEVLELLLARDRRDPRVKGLLDLAAERGVKVHPRPTEVLSKLAGNDHHQGLVAVVRGFRYTDLETVIDQLKNDPAPMVVLLDGVQDPGNLGALVRSAHVLGATAVIIPKDRAAGVTPAARKASAGAAAHLPIVQVVNLARTMEQLFEDHGLWMVGLDHDAPTELAELDLTVPLGLILGGEGQGLRPLTKKRCQLMGRIPAFSSAGGVDSLNVSAAGAVAMYEVTRQRRARQAE
jgi:23S rRNA (guanosine2251-2'-O)-methyltransferase